MPTTGIAMRSFRKELSLNVTTRHGFVNITPRVNECIAPDEPAFLYRHNDTGEVNAAAHLKRQVMGREVVVALTAGRFDFGPWEQIFYGEFDGRRTKRVLVKIIGA